MAADKRIAHPAFWGLLVVTVVLSAIAMFSGGSLNPGEEEDRSNRWVLAAFGAIALLMSYFSAYTDRVDFWTLDGDAIRWVGVTICFLGGTETHGIYGVIRNPSYLGLLLSALGWVLTFRSIVGVLLVVAPNTMRITRARGA